MDNHASGFQNEFLQNIWVLKTLWFLSILIGALGIAYFFWKNLFINWEDVDFKFIWLAGQFWLDGKSPYSPQFVEVGFTLFDNFNGQPFYYPAHFSLISTTLALFEFDTAVELWRWLNIVLFLGSSLILRSALNSTGANLSWRHIVFYTGLVGFMQSVILVFHLGQTTVLIYFGLSLIIFGLHKKNNIVLIIGLCVALLKPQVGIPIVAALLPYKELRKPLLVMCLTMIVISLPATLPLGLLETITAYMQGIASHGEYYSNHAKISTGVRNLIYLIFEYETSSVVPGIASILIAFAVSYYIKLKLSTFAEINTKAQMSLLMAIIITLIAVVSPLHTYDFLILAPVFLISWKFYYPYQICMFGVFTIIVRYDNIVNEMGFLLGPEQQMIGNGLVSLAAIVMLLIIMLNVRKCLASYSRK